jgi:hypothetical protein
MRRLAVAAALAAMLVLGLIVGAWAAIPNGPAFSVCVYNEASATPNKLMQALDKAKGDCPLPHGPSGWTEHTLTAID